MSESAPRIPDDHPAVEKLARLLQPVAFEKSSGLGHQEFAEEDREDRQRARDEAHDLLTTILPLLCGATGPEQGLTPGEQALDEERGRQQKRAEKAEQELEQEQDLRRRADSLLQTERAKLNQVREEVERVERDAGVFAAEAESAKRGSVERAEARARAGSRTSVAQLLRAILDSSSSLSGDGGSSGVGDGLPEWMPERLTLYSYALGAQEASPWTECPPPTGADGVISFDVVPAVLAANSGDVKERGEEGGHWRISNSDEKLTTFDALTRQSAIAHTAGRLVEFFKAEGEPCTTGEAIDEAAEMVDEAKAKPNVEQEQDGVCVTYLTATQAPRHVCTTSAARAAGDDPATAAQEAAPTQQSSTTSNSLSREPGDREQVGRELVATVEREINNWTRRTPSDDYQLGFDAGACEVTKVIYAFFDQPASTQPNPEPHLSEEDDWKDPAEVEAFRRAATGEPHLSGDGERLELIANRIGEEFNDEFPPHETARADIAFLRDLASRLPSEDSSGVEALDQLERWMVDYEGEEGGPVETRLSWITGPNGDPTTKRPDVGEYLIRLRDAKAALTQPDSTTRLSEDGQEAAERKELARQAFVAGAEFAGVELEEPDAQFERHWQEQIGHAADAEVVEHHVPTKGEEGRDG